MNHLRGMILIGLVLLGTCLQAQQVRGLLTETDGTPVPYANVYVENTTHGVVTNVKGQFFMDLDKGEYMLVISSMGYQTKRVAVTVAEEVEEIEVTLEEEGVELETVELTAGKKDPAYAIMEQAVERKREHMRQFQSYTCETYLKASLEVDTIPRKRDAELPDSLRASEEEPDKEEVASQDKDEEKADDGEQGLSIGGAKKERPRLNFIESRSTTNFQFPNQYKSLVHGYRDLAEKSSGGASVSIGGDGVSVQDEYATQINNPYLFYQDVSDADFNFYENLIQINSLSEKPLISPLSSTSWRLTYKYRLVESFMENGRVVHKIEVTPRLDEGPFFQGHIFIEDGTFAIRSVNLQVIPTHLHFFRYFQVVHDYQRTEDGRFVLEKEEYYYNTREGRIRYYGHSIAVHEDYQLDVEFPRGFFRNELRRVEKDAFDKDSLYWVENRAITLKAAEIEFIHVQDSINTYHRSPEFLREQDSTYNKITIWDPFLNGIGYRDRPRGMEYYINPLIEQIRPFGVGGYRHALGGNVSKTWSREHKLRVAGEVDYGFKNNDVRGKIRVGYTYLPRRFGRAYVRYGNTYSMVNVNETVANVFSRSNFINKIYYGVGHHIEVFNGVMLDVNTEWAERKSIEGIELEAWSEELFGPNNTPRSFTDYKEFLINVELKLTPFQKYSMEPYRKVIIGSKWPTLTVRYRKAIPGIWGSQMNSDFLELNLADEFRPGTMGVARWTATAGRFLQANAVQFTDYKFFRGSDRFLFANPLRAFQLLGPTISTPNAYFQGNILHDFNGTLINKIPLLKRTPLQTTFGAGVLLIEDGNFFHSEIYGGLQLPFRIKRQRFKFGTYYVTSYSNHDRALQGQVKFGLTYFNSWLNRWEY